MKNIIFVTSNQDKFHKAKINLEPLGITLIHKELEMREEQSPSGEDIVRHKASQAFEEFRKPLIVNDDTWSIPALRGFPATNMKQCNYFLHAEDWLRLMAGLEDRRVFLISHYAYHNGKTIRLISGQDERYFLPSPQGSNPKSACLEVVARLGSAKSVAEEIAEGRKPETNNKIFWTNFAKLLLDNWKM